MPTVDPEVLEITGAEDKHFALLAAQPSGNDAFWRAEVRASEAHLNSLKEAYNLEVLVGSLARMASENVKTGY